MNNNYENKILDAIQTLVDNAVSKAGYDKTIKGIISKCVNESTGKYVVRYQDSTFYAYSNDLDSVYSGGTSVYVLIPGNDMSQTKTILGSVDKLGTEYISLTESNAAYQEVGNSIVTSRGDRLGVSSYTPGGDTLVIYDKDNSAEDNKVDVDIEGANIYFQNASYLEIGGTFTTKLSDEQKRKGNYGLVFDIDFRDGAVDIDEEEIENHLINKKFVLDINSMTGNPYSYNFGSEQNIIYEIDGANFYRLNRITLECKNFPKSSTPPCINDIFVEDIIMKALTPLTRDEIASNSLTFITKQGTYFSDTDLSSASRLIETEVKIDKKVVPSTSDLLRYYWFKQDSTIGITSIDYSPFGGPGWRILNDYNVIDETNNIRDYLTDANTLTVIKDSQTETEGREHPEWHNLAKENEYKCVIIFNNEIQVERNIIIYNQASHYTISITSDEGNYFKYSEGRPTLTCTVDTDVTPMPTYSYQWSVTDSSNRTRPLAETTTENNIYNGYITTRDTLLEKKASGVWTAEDEASLLEAERNIENYDKNVMRIEGNKIYNIELGEIANFNKYTCSISSSGNFLGKSDIIITNSWDKEDNSYSMIMENGDQIFKYNENGIAPTNKSLAKPIVIKPLQFSVYNEKGQQVEDNKIASTDVSWYVPKENTMLKISDTGIEPIEEKDYLVYTGVKTLNFEIAPLYNNKKMNNSIKLKVKYNDRVLIANSELEFIKEGEIGSNGTDFVCRIVPNVAENSPVPMYPTFTADMSVNPVTGNMNYTRPVGELDKWFKIQLYKDGVLIYEGVSSGTSDEDKAVTINWSMLTNKYSSTISDSTSFSVNSSTGAFSYVDLDTTLDRAANIVKATVSYNNMTYYATMPIILVQAINTNSISYNIDLDNNTGFRYAIYTTDGINPAYDSSNPFALRVYQTVGGVKQDISVATGTATVDYNWSVLGCVYDSTYVSPRPGDQMYWPSCGNLVEKAHTNANPLAHNEKDYKPIEKFDGLSVNNALRCIIKRNNEELVRVYLPIHLYLNRYGNSALNGWDGNHIEINSNGGFILAPQIGAGRKEQNNSYTGVFMSSVREAGSNTEEVGLFGYNSGARTIELNAEDGSAQFGAGRGRITIKPGENSAKLYSSNYRVDRVTPSSIGQTTYQLGYSYWRKETDNSYTLLRARLDNQTLGPNDYHIGDTIPGNVWVWSGGEGLEIDLHDPHIRFGSGYFRIDSDGQLYATGFTTVYELEQGLYNIPAESVKVDGSTALPTVLSNLQSQIDGAIQFWNGEDLPLPNSQYSDWSYANYPAEDWTTEEDRENHRADVYTVIYDEQGVWKQGKGYRFDKIETSPGVEKWLWIELTDNELSAVQALAESKAKVWVVQPTPPYTYGDLWFNNGDLYGVKPGHEKDNTGSFSADDWELATKYTDNTALNTFISNTYSPTVQSLQTQVDGKSETWYQTADPSTSWTTAELKAKHEGDLWFNPSENKNYIYQKNSSNVYEWKEVDGVPQTVYDKIDGKAQIFASQPTPPYRENDLWVQGENGDIKYCINTRLSGSFVDTDWDISSKYTDDTTANQVQTNLNNLQIGARNLARKGAIVNYSGYTTVVDTNYRTDGSCNFSRVAQPYDGVILDRYINYKQGQKYIISFQIKKVSGTVNNFYLWDDGSKPHTNSKVFIDGVESGTLKKLYTYPNDTNYHTIQIYFTGTAKTTAEVEGTDPSYHILIQPSRNDSVAYEMQIFNFKIEEGTKPTNWTRPPEDEVKTLDVEYYLSTSSTSLSGGSWSVTAPEWVDGKYMWSRQKLTYGDGSYEYKNETCIAGATGATGSTGTGIESITEQYYLSTRKDTQAGGSWVDSPPAWENGKYIWTRSKIIYKNPSSTAYTTPLCSSEWEAINDLIVGGRNLLQRTQAFTNTGVQSTEMGYMKSGYAISGTYNNFVTRGFTTAITSMSTLTEYQVLNCKPKEQYTFSFYAKGDGRGRAYFYGPSGYIQIAQIKGTSDATGTITTRNDNDGRFDFTLSNEWTRYYITYTLKDTYPTEANVSTKYALIRNDNLANAFEICGLKLEKGNMASEWSPAPEDEIKSLDVEYYLSTSSTSTTGGSWSTTAPQWEDGKYMWSRQKLTYGNGYIEYKNQTCIAGAKGNGISTVTTEYAVDALADVTVTGTDLSFVSEEDTIKNLVIQGDAVQESSQGLNLLKNTNVNSGDNNYWANYSTFDELKRTLTRSTTATSEQYIVHKINGLQSNHTYTLVFEASKNSNVVSVEAFCYNKNTQGIKNKQFSVTTNFQRFVWSFTTDSDIDYSDNATIRFDNNGSASAGQTATLTVRNVMLLDGTYTAETAPVYQDYGITPSPDSPQVINKVTGIQKIKNIGHNWFDMNIWNDMSIANGTKEINGNAITLKNPQGGDVYMSGTNIGATFYPESSWKYMYEVQPNTKYYLSFDKTSTTLTGSQSDSSYLAFIDKDHVYIPNLVPLTSAIGARTKIEVTTPANCKYISMRFGVRMSVGEITYSNIMLTDINTDKFEEYKEITEELNFGKNLYISSQDFSGDWVNSDSWETDSSTYNGLTVKKKIGTWNGISKNLYIEKGCIYTFSCYVKADQARTCKLYTVNSGDYIITSPYDKDLSVTTDWQRFSYTFTCIKSGYIRPRIENPTSISGKYTYICGYQLEKSDKMTDYAPYFPPIELLKTGTIKDEIRRGTGKNLFNQYTLVMKNYPGADSTTRACNLQQLYLTPGTYKFSTNLDLNNFEYKNDILAAPPTTVSTETYIYNSGWITANNYTITFNQGGFFALLLKKKDGSDFVLSDLNDVYFQLEKGSIITEYEPYGFANKWYKYGLIGKDIFDGTNYAFDALIKTDNSSYIVVNKYGSKYKKLASNNDYAPISEKLRKGSISQTYNGQVNTVAQGGNGQYLQVCLPYSIGSTLEAVNTWLETNTLPVYYLENRPICTLLNDTLQNQLNSLKIFEDYNDIHITSNDLPGILNLTYTRTTETPTEWQSTMPLDVKPGQYLWTRVTTTYTDPNMSDTVTYLYTKVPKPIDNIEDNQIEIGGRNLLKYTGYESQSLVGYSKRGDGIVLEIDSTSTGQFQNNNSLKITCGVSCVSGSIDIWQKCWGELQVNKPLRLSFFIKGSTESNAWFRLGGAQSDGEIQKAPVSTYWQKIDLDLGKVVNGGIAGQTEVIYGFDSPGVYYINSMMLEYGNIVSDWSAAPEDDKVATIIEYITTTTNQLPDIDSEDWTTNRPTAGDLFIWQRTGTKEVNAPSTSYNTPVCIYMPATTLSSIEYCLCTSNVYDEAKVIPYDDEGNKWRATAFEWKDSYATGPDNPTYNDVKVNTYQFMRTKYEDKYDTEKSITPSTPILDNNWLTFGKMSYLKSVEVDRLSKITSNTVIQQTQTDGIYFYNRENTYRIHINSGGINFGKKVNGNWTEFNAWNIDGTLNTDLITVTTIKASDIESGKLSLTDTKWKSAEGVEAAFILNGPVVNMVKIDTDGVEVNNLTGDSIVLGTSSYGGIAAYVNGDTEKTSPYFSTNPNTKTTSMAKAQITNELILFGKVKVIETSKGFSMVRMSSN